METHHPPETTALVRKRDSTALMAPPPPVKKIKRPKQILDEDSYTEALSHIIARDFFPGLLETETKQEYMDALDSKDPAWIASAGRRLQSVMTPGKERDTSAQQVRPDTGETPRHYVGDTPSSQVRSSPQTSSVGQAMSLSKFQSTYTSEDNESFYKLVDKQNQKKADKYAWLWRGNKLPSKQMIKQREVEDKISQTRSLYDDGHTKKLLAIKDSDDRPARPDSWTSDPRNGLMFSPDEADESLQSPAQQADERSRMGPKAIIYQNTRMPDPYLPPRPPSPTASSIREAVAGHPRAKDQDSSVVGGGETPKVNGYSFVDEDDDQEPETTASAAPIDLGPGDSHNPFHIQGQRDRELLHERMVDRISKSNQEYLKNGFTGRIKATVASTPKFASSPRTKEILTPAAQRLWHTIGTPQRRTGADSFGQLNSTPRRKGGSRLKSVARPASKPD